MSNNAEPQPRYHIDLNWYEENNRSFLALVQDRLCPACRDKFAAGESSEVALLETIRDCCSNEPGFTTSHSPILETLFRMFLANGNEPLTLAEIEQRMRELREGNFSPTSGVLHHLLNHDRYYGFRQTPLEEKGDEKQV